MSNGALAKQLPAVLLPEAGRSFGAPGSRTFVAMLLSIRAWQRSCKRTARRVLSYPAFGHRNHALENPERKPAPSREPRIHSDPQNAAALEVGGFTTIAVFFRGDTHKSTHRFSRRALFLNATQFSERCVRSRSANGIYSSLGRHSATTVLLSSPGSTSPATQAGVAKCSTRNCPAPGSSLGAVKQPFGERD